MGELPTDIISQILYRSPAKSVFRFRFVSKSWCILIDSPHFINTHLSLSRKSNTDLTLIILQKFNKRNHLYSLDFCSLHTPLAFENKFIAEYILGSCNGLLLLGSDHPLQLVLFNPSTRDYRKIPDSPYVYGEHRITQNCGFAYDSFKDDYKLIKVVMTPRHNQKLWVYSLKSNFWKIICDDFPYYINYDSYYSGWKADINGTLHMLANKHFTNSTKLIVAVDVARENFYVVPKPDCLNEQVFDENVDVLGGCLCLIILYCGYTDVWVMNVYGIKESWIKLFTIHKHHNAVYVQLLGYSKKHNKVLLNIDGDKLVWFNLETREILDVEVRGLPIFFSSRVYTSSLVPLNGYGKSGAQRSTDVDVARISRERTLI